MLTAVVRSRMMKKPAQWVAAVLGALCASASFADTAADLASKVKEPPTSDFPCKTGADTAAAMASGVAEQCLAQFGGKLGDYLSYAPQGLFALMVPVTREWFISEMTSKLTKDAKVCVLKGLAQGAGATPETTKLIGAGFEEYQALQGQAKFLEDISKYPDLFKAMRQHGDQFVRDDEVLSKSLDNFNKFSWYFNKKLETQAKAATSKPQSAIEAFSKWFNTADRRARNEASEARQAMEECDFPAAMAKLGSAQALNVEWLGVLRTEISRTKKKQWCEEVWLRKNPTRALSGDNPYGVQNMKELAAELLEYQEADRALVAYMGELSGLAEKVVAQEKKLKEQQERDQRGVEEIKASLKACDLLAAQRQLDALNTVARDTRCNQMTQTGPTPWNDEFARRERLVLQSSIDEKKKETERAKQELQSEYNDVMAIAPATSEECNRIDLTATMFERWAGEDPCRNRHDAAAKAAELRAKARACKLGPQPTPPPQLQGACDPAVLSAVLGQWFTIKGVGVTLTGSCDRMVADWQYSPRSRPEKSYGHLNTDTRVVVMYFTETWNDQTLPRVRLLLSMDGQTLDESYVSSTGESRGIIRELHR